MKKILFRAKQIDDNKWVDGKWVEGHYFSNCNGTWIFQYPYHATFTGIDVMVKVDPETVGQYTGITDRNGTKIFEGDIVKWKDELYEIVYLPKYTRFAARKPHVVFEIIALELSEVVGNIHDNPKLIEEWKDE